MKSYNINNYIRYKKDIKKVIQRVESRAWDEYNRHELIVKFLPLVENLARKFSTSQQASGVMDITDMIQSGSIGLVAAVDNIDKNRLQESPDMEKTLKSFLSKRIKGAIRRAIDINRGDIKIPEHKLNEIRKDFGKDQKMVALFFNSVFSSIDAVAYEDNSVYEIPDKSEPYNKELLNQYLLGLLAKHLTFVEAEVLRLSYGLDCDKYAAKQIADKLSIEGSSSHVRISQLKRQAIDKLIDTVDHSQVLDYL